MVSRRDLIFGGALLGAGAAVGFGAPRVFGTIFSAEKSFKRMVEKNFPHLRGMAKAIDISALPKSDLSLDDVAEFDWVKSHRSQKQNGEYIRVNGFLLSKAEVELLKIMKEHPAYAD